MSKKLSIAGVDLELHEKGQGRPLLFLHSGEGLHPERAWFDALAKNFRVIAPCHPGWGQSSLPDWFGSVDDIAYLYLDLADKLDLKDAVLAGNSFGGWIAAEMLVRSTHASPSSCWPIPSASRSPGAMSATSPICMPCRAPIT